MRLGMDSVIQQDGRAAPASAQASFGSPSRGQLISRAGHGHPHSPRHSLSRPPLQAPSPGGRVRIAVGARPPLSPRQTPLPARPKAVPLTVPATAPRCPASAPRCPAPAPRPPGPSSPAPIRAAAARPGPRTPEVGVGSRGARPASRCRPRAASRVTYSGLHRSAPPRVRSGLTCPASVWNGIQSSVCSGYVLDLPGLSHPIQPTAQGTRTAMLPIQACHAEAVKSKALPSSPPPLEACSRVSEEDARSEASGAWSLRPVTIESESASDVKRSWLSQPQRRPQMPDLKADGRGSRAVGWHHHQLPVRHFRQMARHRTQKPIQCHWPKCRSWRLTDAGSSQGTCKKREVVRGHTEL
ncbi:translation initiation factor IF-2-like [Mesocricetus auratus]|uniref:Translation initiation factor IF-2-like n=1 Tax=Mesocricetus auratus TaxID=10036 RepID=A0ABM2YEY5_MESAU|nr:translation initiation factor IF-2-like [Mesocricetus auratus]